MFPNDFFQISKAIYSKFGFNEELSLPSFYLLVNYTKFYLTVTELIGISDRPQS